MAKATKSTGAKVTIKDLCLEYGVEGKDLRALLRANGFKAPEIAREPGVFGPKAKYEWDADSADLKKIRTLVESTLENDEEEATTPAAPKAKGKKATEIEVEEDEDDEEPAPKAKAKGKGKK